MDNESDTEAEMGRVFAHGESKKISTYTVSLILDGKKSTIVVSKPGRYDYTIKVPDNYSALKLYKQIKTVRDINRYL
jgi:hypothetical protein